MNDILKDPARRAEWIHGQPMQPCPKCGGYEIMTQTPIKLDLRGGEDAKAILGAWARATSGGATPLEGPVYMGCLTCLHAGPAVDCSGRTRESVGGDKALYAEIRRLWNERE